MPLIRFCAALALTLPLATAAPAAEVPGADDPAFEAAVEAWLDGEGLPALAEMARLAREGNSAARLLLARMRGT